MISRRLFLRGAAVAAPMVAVPALAAAARNYAEENPALLALKPELEAAEAEMIAATEAYQEAYRIGMTNWPKPTATMALPWRPTRWEEFEHDIAGRNYTDRPGVYRISDLQYDAGRIKRWRKITPEREAERAKFLAFYADVEAYEAACKQAKEVSGFDAADARQTAAWDAMRNLVDRVRSEPANTMAGVLIKARAANAWGTVPKLQRALEAVEGNLIGDLSASLLAVLEG